MSLQTVYLCYSHDYDKVLYIELKWSTKKTFIDLGRDFMISPGLWYIFHQLLSNISSRSGGHFICPKPFRIQIQNSQKQQIYKLRLSLQICYSCWFWATLWYDQVRHSFRIINKKLECGEIRFLLLGQQRCPVQLDHSSLLGAKSSVETNGT